MASPQLYRLEIAPLFNGLSEQEKHYAHYMARYMVAWFFRLSFTRSELMRLEQSRLVGRQDHLPTGFPESLPIYDFILALYQSCDGDWASIVGSGIVTDEDMASFLEYAAQFLSNVGNHYGSGDQKFVPRLSPGALETLATSSPTAKALYAQFKD
ncbi:dipeptidyl peptidase III [Apiospora phragmitis]|uniref:Dipeptidyl peptidase III n=1 Tax=Apiospora phragmitis TaxID=2905665 RepID=A0ABR1VF67_9PEZI